jgi:hypothetical protein
MPPLSFNRPARDSQAETCTSTSTRSRLVDAVKPIKNFLLVLRRDSWTLVDDFYHGVCAASSDPQADKQPFCAVADRVVY